MAESAIVNAVIDQLKARGSMYGSKNYASVIGQALDSGLDGPTIVNFISAYTDGDGAYKLGELVRSRTAAAKAETQQAEKVVAAAAAGFVAPAAPVTNFSGGGTSSPTGGGQRTAFDMLKESYPDTPISITADGTAIVRVGSDEYAYNISGASPVILAVNGKAYGGGGAVATGGGGSGASAPVARYGFESIGGKVYRTNDLTGAVEDTGIVAPGFSNIAVDRTGNLTGIDSSGKFTVIQPNYGFAEIDPATTAARKQQEFDITAGQNATDEQGRNTRNTQSETAANERARLSSATTGFQSVNALAPQLGNLALDNAKFTRDTLREAPDYLARAFFQQGQTSPLPQVSQADVINNLRDNIAKYQATLSGFGTTVPGFTSPTPAAVAPPAAVTQTPAGFSPPPTGVQPGFTTPPTFVADGGSVAPVNGVSPLTRKDTPAWALPGMAEGGFTTEPMFKGNEEGAELIINPTNAPLAVVDAETTKKITGKGSIPGFAGGTGAIVYDPVAQHWTQNGQVVNAFEAAAGASAPAPAAPAPILGPTAGGFDPAPVVPKPPVVPPTTTPGFSFAAPTLPTFPAVTQSGLQDLERSVRPPAVNAVMSGMSAAPPRFGFSLPTMQNLDSLTNDDKLAYNTALGTQFNETYANVEGEVKRRARNPESRRAATVAGFQ